MARIAFCQDVMVEYMSFMCMSGVLKSAGHTVELFFDDQRNEDRFLGELRAFRPDVVGFSILSPSVPWALRVGARVRRELGALTVFGNVHAIMEPGIIEAPGVDAVCIGEGEKPLLELARRLDAGRPYYDIPGLWFDAGGRIVKNSNPDELVEMDEMPYIDRAMYDKYSFFRHSRYLRVMVGRGCPFRCSFCSNTNLTDHYGGAAVYVRKQSPLRAIEELEYLIASRPRPVEHVFFIDEVFWVKNGWLREFLALYKERIRLPFTANFRFGGIREEDIREMAEAGATNMTLATESADEHQRREVLNKPVSNAQILQVAEWMHRYGVDFVSSSFFGLPGDSFEDHLRRLDFFGEVGPAYLWTTFFQPYPGLDLTAAMSTQEHMPERRDFGVTFHHDMYLDLPDRTRLVNLKKVYFLLYKFPRLRPVLLRFVELEAPLLFDALFMLHFAYYALKFERISALQLLKQIQIFGLNPLLRRVQPLQNQGRPYVPPAPTPLAADGP